MGSDMLVLNHTHSALPRTIQFEVIYWNLPEFPQLQHPRGILQSASELHQPPVLPETNLPTDKCSLCSLFFDM